MSWRDDLKRFNGPYYRWALENRRKFLTTELATEKALAKEVEGMVKDLSVSIEGMPSDVAAQMKYVKAGLKDFAKALNGKQKDIISKGIEKAVGIGVEYNEKVSADLLLKVFPEVAGKIQNVFGSVQEDVIKAMWNRRVGGLYLSDRIWNITGDTTEAIGRILTAGIAENMDPVDIARALTKYVKEGSGTLVKDYPNMMKRMGRRLPKDLNYESLRLVRTELSAAHGDATLKSATYNPACRGVKWVLSSEHPEYDICDELAYADQGFGPGVYRVEDAPPMPAHPNCLCFFTEVVEDPSSFVQRLERFRDNPDSDPELQEYWQRTFAKPSRKAPAEKVRTLKEKFKKFEPLPMPDGVRNALLDHTPYANGILQDIYKADYDSEKTFFVNALLRYIDGTPIIQKISTEIALGNYKEWLNPKKLNFVEKWLVRWIKTALDLMEQAVPYVNELIRVEPLYVYENLDKMKAGDVITQGIRSWSQKDVIYKEWGELYCVHKGGFVALHVKGAKGINVSAFSHYAEQYEVLCAGDYRVLDIKKEKFIKDGQALGDVVHIFVEQINVYPQLRTGKGRIK